MKHVPARKKNTPIKVFPQGFVGLSGHGLGVISLVVGHLTTLGCGAPQAEAKASKSAQVIVEDEGAGRVSTRDQSRAAESTAPIAHEAQAVLTFAHQSLVVRAPSSWGLVAEPSLGSWGRATTSQNEDQLLVFHQPARRTITLAECETEARASLQILRHGLSATNERPWDPLPDYAGTLRVVLLDDGSTLVEAYAVSFSRCLSAVYRVKGGQDYAQRLTLVVTSVLSRLSLMRRVVTAPSPPF
jgi:hypothetical protein